MEIMYIHKPFCKKKKKKNIISKLIIPIRGREFDVETNVSTQNTIRGLNIGVFPLYCEKMFNYEEYDFTY